MRKNAYKKRQKWYETLQTELLNWKAGARGFRFMSIHSICVALYAPLKTIQYPGSDTRAYYKPIAKTPVGFIRRTQLKIRPQNPSNLIPLQSLVPLIMKYLIMLGLKTCNLHICKCSKFMNIFSNIYLMYVENWKLWNLRFIQLFYNYTVGHENVTFYFWLYLRQLYSQNSFTSTLSCVQYAIMWLLYIQLHHKCVSTLPCEI